MANHAVESNGKHLKMYLGGMAGIGKSQVIKALIHFFAKKFAQDTGQELVDLYSINCLGADPTNAIPKN